jgi:hypothetical protein
MTTISYYIENTEFGTVLMNDGSWVQFTPDLDAEVFPSFEDAVSHVSNLEDGTYRVFSRIVKS